MLILETIAKIRRAFFVQGKSIKFICRELNVSRKVVRKVIRSEATEFRYERESQPLPKIGPWTDQLDELLLANEGRPARERLTLIRLFEELRGRGYGGGYDAVRPFTSPADRLKGHPQEREHSAAIFGGTRDRVHPGEGCRMARQGWMPARAETVLAGSVHDSPARKATMFAPSMRPNGLRSEHY